MKYIKYNPWENIEILAVHPNIFHDRPGQYLYNNKSLPYLTHLMKSLELSMLRPMILPHVERYSA